MTEKILKFMGFSKKEPEKKDDFSDFINAKSGDKIKIIRQVLREATEEQRVLMAKHKEKTA